MTLQRQAKNPVTPVTLSLQVDSKMMKELTLPQGESKTTLYKTVTLADYQGM